MLLSTFTDPGKPTILRSSALSILALCLENAPLALLQYTGQLLDAALTLLSLESRPVSRKASSNEGEEEPNDHDQFSEELAALGLNKPKIARRPEETPKPLSQDTNHPALRRAALLFVALLARSESVEGAGQLVPMDMRERARTVIGYVAMVDEDGLVRHQARETEEELLAL